MRGRPALLALALLAPALAGCLGGAPPQAQAPEPEQPTATPSPTPSPQPPPQSPPSPTPTPRPPTPAPPGTPEPLPDPGPLVVIAHIDTGINPYHAAFRDGSPLAQRHPCTYLKVPCDTPALNLSLDAKSYDEARERDRDVWEKVERGKLYWIPGTRVLAISLRPGGVLCPQPDLAPPALPDPLPPPPVLPQRVTCNELPILDDHGHGTMTASRMAGAGHSLCGTPECRIVSIEGLGGESVRWAAQQGWIDVQTNSWGLRLPEGFVPDASASPPLPAWKAIRDAFTFAAQRMLVFVASGNGVRFSGGVGEPTQVQATGSAGVIDVGAHDNGRATLYHGQPPHVVADGYGGYRASARSIDEFVPSPEACCTSASSPYAAGGGAAALLAARRALDARGTGMPQGVAADGTFQATNGPLTDGRLTLDELRRLVLVSARPRPVQGPDDGLLHWAAQAPDRQPKDPTDLGENPYCVGCWATPVRWSDLPPEAPLSHLVGYGAVDPFSADTAARILRGEVRAPDRAAEDALFAADQAARGALDRP